MSKIKELGEFELIHRLSSRLKFRASNTVLGIGDDCAVYPVKSGANEVISTDALRSEERRVGKEGRSRWAP